jgi:hypothetical protein
LAFAHISQVNGVRRAAADIELGDTEANVLARLGPPRVQYIKEFPPQGGPANVHGVSYGGPLNLLRSTLDHWAYRAFESLPEWSEWYHRYIAQDVTDWPVVIEFDQSGTVTTIKQ